MKYFLIYLVAISLLSVIICIYDKIAARFSRRRIRESTLLWLSALGGAAAMYITMCIIRHKTKHTKFMLGLPFIILVQTAIVILNYCNI